MHHREWLYCHWLILIVIIFPSWTVAQNDTSSHNDTSPFRLGETGALTAENDGDIIVNVPPAATVTETSFVTVYESGPTPLIKDMLGFLRRGGRRPIIPPPANEVPTDSNFTGLGPIVGVLNDNSSHPIPVNITLKNDTSVAVNNNNRTNGTQIPPPKASKIQAAPKPKQPAQNPSPPAENPPFWVWIAIACSAFAGIVLTAVLIWMRTGKKRHQTPYWLKVNGRQRSRTNCTIEADAFSLETEMRNSQAEHDGARDSVILPPAPNVFIRPRPT